MSHGPIAIRPAVLDDLPAINDIWNEQVLRGTACFDHVPMDLACRREWFDAHDVNHPVLVAHRRGTVLGWAAVHGWARRDGTAATVEHSVYVGSDARGQGVGRALVEELLDIGGRIGWHAVIGLVESGNAASLAFHEKLGFRQVGRLRQVGYKFGRWLDVTVVQYLYGPWPDDPNP